MAGMKPLTRSPADSRFHGMKRAGLLICCLLIPAWIAHSAAADTPEVDNPEPVWETNKLVITTSAHQIFDEDLRRDLESGFDIKIRFIVRLVREINLWRNRIKHTAYAERRVHYDTIQREYRITCKNQGVKSVAIVSGEEAMEKVVRTCRVEFPRPELKLEPDHQYRVAVCAEISSERTPSLLRQIFLFASKVQSTAWKAVRLPVPNGNRQP